MNDSRARIWNSQALSDKPYSNTTQSIAVRVMHNPAKYALTIAKIG